MNVAAGVWQQRAAEQLFACLARAGRRARLEQLHERLDTRADPPALLYYLGLACAREGDSENAVRYLRQVVALAPDHPQARQLAYRLLLKRAGEQARAGKWEVVSGALATAVEVAPPGADTARDLARYRNLAPLAHIRAGNRREAARLWEQQLREEPANTRLVHNLAVLYYWWAHGEERAGREGKQPPWTLAAAYWTALVNIEGYWNELRQQKQKAWGFTIADQDLEALRGSFLDEHFFKRFRSQASDYKEKNNEPESRRHEEYYTAALWEKRSAECWRQTMALLERKLPKGEARPWDRARLLALPAGYGFFERFSLLEEIAKAGARLAELAPDAECLPWLKIWFAPERLGRIAVLVEERSRPDEALALLEALPAGAKKSPEAVYLRARGLARRAAALFQAGQASEALKTWKSLFKLLGEALKETRGGAALPRLLQGVREEASKEAVKALEDETSRLKKDDKLDEAIKLLEQSLDLQCNGRAKELLAVLYCDRAGPKMKDKRFAAAREDFQKALKLNPNHASAKSGMSTAYNNDGAEKDSPEAAIPLYEKALEYNPDNHTAKRNLAAAKTAKAIQIFNNAGSYISRSQASQGVALLKDAARLLDLKTDREALNSLRTLAMISSDALKMALGKVGDELAQHILLNLGIALAIEQRT